MNTIAIGMILVILLILTNVNISESSTLGKLVVKVKPESETVSANQSPVIGEQLQTKEENQLKMSKYV